MSLSSAARALFVAGFLALLSLLATSAIAQSPPTVSWPPSPSVKLALNPVTNKVYTIDEQGRSVTVLDVANGTTRTIGVGSRPYYIAVNPGTNRVYVNDMNDASLTVIDGATDTVLAVLPMGSIGPIQVNPITNVVYVIRLTSPTTDEITYVNGDTDTSYTIATQSFQPIAMAINPVTDTIYAAHYATGDVRVIPGAYSGNDHPATFSIGVWSRPFAIAANPVTNKVYGITEDARGPVFIIDGATRTATFPTVPSGRAVGPRAIAMNTVTNKVYAAFQNEVVVIDGASGALAFIPLGTTGSGAMEIAVNHATNKIYVAVDNGSLWVIDGATNAASAVGIPAGAVALGVNPITNKAYVFNGSTTVVDGAAGATMANPITTSITPLAGNTSGADATFTINASSSFVPNSMPVRKVYYQLDSTAGAWTQASGSGPWTASFANLGNGSHTLYAFATDGQDAPLYTSSASAPLLGTLTAYTFTVGTAPPAAASVSLASSKNPSVSGDSVTFTATVSGSAGTATGNVEFRNGGTAIAGCAAVALANGTAACTTTALPVGTHSITAHYAGSSAYAAATSGAISQVVNAPKTTINVSLSSSPNPSEQGQSVAIVASLAAGTTAATGTVEFRAGGAVIAGCSAVAVSGNSATCTTTSLAVGTLSLLASYSGNASYNPSSGSSTHVVNAKPTPTPVNPTVSISSSLNPSTQGQSVTFTARITGSAGATTGIVQFWNGSSTITGCNNVDAASGTATCTTSTLPVGSLEIRAHYSGNAAYNPASATLTQVVNGAKTTIGVQVSSSPNPSEQGQAVSIVARMAATGTAATGTVEFRAGSSVINGCSAVTVASDMATCNTSTLAVGTHTLTAMYSGNAAYNPSSGTASHVVNEKPAAVVASNLTFPTAGATLEARKQAFMWQAVSGASFQLLVGSSLGASDVARVTTTRTSASVNKMPTDGRTIYVRLVTTVNGASAARDYTFFAHSKMSATLEAPKQLRSFKKAKETFKWDEVSGATYTLSAGTEAGSSNLGQTGTTRTEADMNGLPTNGRMVYVRLTTVKDGKARFRDYAFGKDVEELDDE